jgi:hypothetical protein
LPDCAQDIPSWFNRYRYQLTQVTLPFEQAVALLGGTTATRRSRGTFTVNGRVYGVHNGSIHPIKGEGLIQLDRQGYKALAAFNEYGDSQLAMRYLTESRIPPEAIEAGRHAWEVGRR